MQNRKLTMSLLALGLCWGTLAPSVFAAQSSPPYVSDIVIVNNNGPSDTITVRDLAETTLVKVYADAVTTTVLCSGTVAAMATDITIPCNVNSIASGSVFITTTKTPDTESRRIERS